MAVETRTPEIQSFPIAPMSALIRASTYGLFALPVLFLVLGFIVPVVGIVMIAVAAFILVLYAFTRAWLRPRRFVLTDQSLRIEWPLRTRVVQRASIGAAEAIAPREFRATYGWGMRFGAGGLWGGFGLLVTRNGTLAMYISRLDGLVLVPVQGDRTLLITPKDPEGFATALATTPEPLRRSA